MTRSLAHLWTRRSLALGVFTVAALGFAAPSANAESALPCTARTTSAKFAAVDNDQNLYFTAPSGDFENGTTGWSLTSASVVTGNEPWNVNGSARSKSLKISSGGKAVSPLFCNQSGEKALRFFYYGTAGARIQITMNVTNADTGNRATSTRTVSLPTTGWHVSSYLQIPDMYSQGYEQLQLTFSATNGSVQVDDVEIDPWKPN